MGNPPSDTDAEEGADPGLEGEPTAPTARWVKVFGAIVLVVIVLFVILLFGRGHGPGRHFGSPDSTSPTRHGGGHR